MGHVNFYAQQNVCSCFESDEWMRNLNQYTDYGAPNGQWVVVWRQSEWDAGNATHRYRSEVQLGIGHIADVTGLWSIWNWSHMVRQYVHSKGRVKTHNPSANQRRAISSVGMESSFLAIRQDGEQIVHTQGTGVVLVYVWRWSSHIEIPGKRPIRSGLGIVV